MINETMRKFGYPATLLRDYDHWVVLLRPAQVTLGSLVLAAKSDATAFGQLPSGAHAELAKITAEIEATLAALIRYDRVNYLMLMMVDPHVHFHIFPRHEGSRELGKLRIVDASWPGPPDLKSGQELTREAVEALKLWLTQSWVIIH